ncbi:coiled-coil domain-containing protein [Helicobacter cetorum]|uniref:Uncharacterized protein n=1 Tax=Helicobacter cetorum (strain ATCC BAA-429 / MIT 00-7128) TaxID=182217 RepID=I0ENV8_HELC0|nr:hypothetical protein [Helicobacter cetorum]AFI04627.1 hypothetical protein HCW_06845 [Helicobacter cetorum MIT 00-7128]
MALKSITQSLNKQELKTLLEFVEENASFFAHILHELDKNFTQNSALLKFELDAKGDLKVSNANSVIKKYEDSYKKLEQEFEDFKSKGKELNKEYKKLKQQLQSQENIKKNLEKELENIKAKNKSLNSRHKREQAHLKKQNTQDLSSQLQLEKHNYEKLQEEYSQLEQDYKELKEIKFMLEKTHHNQKEQGIKVHEKYEVKIEALERKIDFLKTMNANLESKNQALQQELNALKKSLDNQICQTSLANEISTQNNESSFIAKSIDIAEKPTTELQPKRKPKWRR